MFNCSKDPFNDSRLADGDRNLCADLFADSLILPEPVEFVILIGFFKRKDQKRDFLFLSKATKSNTLRASSYECLCYLIGEYLSQYYKKK